MTCCECCKVLSTADLAALLKVSVKTIYAWNGKGTGPPYVVIGKHARYLRSDVHDWLRAHYRNEAEQ